MIKKRPAGAPGQACPREGDEGVDPQGGSLRGGRRSLTMRSLILPAGAGLIMLAACQPAPEGEEGVENIAGEENAPDMRPSAPEVLPSRTPEPDEIGAPEAPAGVGAAAPADTVRGPIPPAYRGAWAIETKDCRGQPGMTRIAVMPAEIGYYEGRSEVKTATRVGSRLTIDVVHHAEGMTEKSRQTIDLSADGQRLSFSRGGTSFAYRKCG